MCTACEREGASWVHNCQMFPVTHKCFVLALTVPYVTLILSLYIICGSLQKQVLFLVLQLHFISVYSNVKPYFFKAL